MKAWTDYPIFALGDKPYQIVPVREVEAVCYDRDKYCMVQIPGVPGYTEIKAGYLYQEPRREGKPLSEEQLSQIPDYPED